MLGFMANGSVSSKMMLMHPSFVYPPGPSPSLKMYDVHHVPRSYHRSMESFLQEVHQQFDVSLDARGLLVISEQLQDQFRARLRSHPHCMLPSYNHTLPEGDERGTYVVLDVGGSTLRVALVKLSGRTAADDPMRILRMETSHIDSSVKALKGVAFFDWLAAKVEHVLVKSRVRHDQECMAVPVGLAWSFPIAQTSMRTGRLLGMGKGFACSSSILGQDLGEVLEQACRRRKLNIRIGALLNDSSATLLSSAYLNNSTGTALIFGTGMNAAVHLPMTALGPDKFTARPRGCHDRAEHVLVNTELSMFGKDILPTTRWDEELNSCHRIPNYQPFEYLITGAHLGEIVRLILVEMAVETGFLGGQLPIALQKPYSICPQTMAIIEADDTPTLVNACSYIQDKYCFPTLPTPEDLQYIQAICRCVSRRAAIFLATGMHALWKLQIISDWLDPLKSGHVTVGCTGSVINKYPGFFDRCQEYINVLTEAEGFGRGRVTLEPTYEAAIRGAAVAVALAEKEEAP